DRARAGRIIANHAAQIGPAGGGDVGPELQAVYRQGPIQLIQNDPGLDAGYSCPRVNVHQSIEILATVENNTGPDGLTRKADAPRGGRYWYVDLAGDLHGGGNYVDRIGNYGFGRLDLVDGGVRAIEAA